MRVRIFIATAAVAMFLAVPAAHAYQESTTTVDPADTPPGSCLTCHGRESDEPSTTVAQTRKGPHGGYTAGTNKCESCHSVHSASADGAVLLPQATVVDTCNTCHDGTGGGGVYGVIKRRTGLEPAGHKIGFANGGRVTVPGGDPSGGSIESTFSAGNGGLTCIDCHSPHDADTVEPFIGDRLRSVNDTTSGTIATNRLLRRKPTTGETSVSAYGTDWCEECHKGRRQGTMNHPVAGLSSVPSADYSHVTRVAGYDTSAVAPTKGPLGGSNFGYIVPATSGALPICQQCHEDSRSIGNVATLTVDAATESFNPQVDGVAAGNPRFQNFPHETVNANMLVEARDSLCLNCHSLDDGSLVH